MQVSDLGYLVNKNTEQYKSDTREVENTGACHCVAQAGGYLDNVLDYIWRNVPVRAMVLFLKK
jgi:hypothetical protein